ncbi:MAG: peptidoglycan-associated lipoprotein Pal [Gammaproteobacteria bacterium]|nr:peptidoglycan-associated lipoprotein Pal [Gammaproteobacteria bacterium]MCW8910397.1 peptidoglycan-associated lipoprotein Pal [Gammaproteobacteria bacterium]MCW9004615.1 peptidoglycan-associated lipoprotein Pal [Gammaproteobacteria bacterium]MCW9056666.1 peptidoglycan-associated lipoprotein Pal [Gammaproteobacteria bacterium]
MKLKIFSVLLAAVFLVACDPAQVKDDDSAAGQTGDQTTTGGVTGDGAYSGRYMDNVSYDRAAINDTGSVLAERVIYFDFDSDQISQDYQDLLSHHGKYLAANSDVSVRLEGHADERGTREYNVALGNRRAQAVRRLILLQGAAASQVSVISYGEEKPVALSHDEEAWRLNRRAELIYQTN